MSNNEQYTLRVYKRVKCLKNPNWKIFTQHKLPSTVYRGKFSNLKSNIKSLKICSLKVQI